MKVSWMFDDNPNRRATYKTWAMRHMNKQLLYPWRARFTCDISIKMGPTVSTKEKNKHSFEIRSVRTNSCHNNCKMRISNIEHWKQFYIEIFIDQFTHWLYKLLSATSIESTNRYMDSFSIYSVTCVKLNQTAKRREVTNGCSMCKRRQKENKSKRKEKQKGQTENWITKRRLNQRVVI